MKALGEFEVWFLTGSQDLYGDETLRQVADNSKRIAVALLLLTAVAVGFGAQTDRRQDEAVWRDPMSWLGRGFPPPARASG